MSVSASIAERMSGISSNPAEDLALAKIEKKRKLSFLREKILYFLCQGKRIFPDASPTQAAAQHSPVLAITQERREALEEY